MDMRGVKPKDIQEYLGFGCVQSVYRWLDGVSMPTVDNLYAISKMLQVPMDSIVCGNAGRTKSQMAACLFSYSFSKPGFKNILKASRFMVFSSFL